MKVSLCLEFIVIPNTDAALVCYEDPEFSDMRDKFSDVFEDLYEGFSINPKHAAQITWVPISFTEADLAEIQKMGNLEIPDHIPLYSGESLTDGVRKFETAPNQDGVSLVISYRFSDDTPRVYSGRIKEWWEEQRQNNTTNKED